MKELWAECVDWLVASGVLDVSVGLRLVKPADLAVILRDGVLLCELALKLTPGCIDRSEMFLQYEENQRSPFMRAKNISLFLDVCQSQFGLTQLFNSNDLYDLEDFGRVLRVLSLLSHSQQAASAGLRPFPEANQASSTAADESIYCNLQEEIDKAGQTVLPFSSQHAEDQQATTAKPVPSFESEDDHYGFIGTLHDNRNQREQLYDTIVARGPSASVSSRHGSIPKRYLDFKPTNKRGHCIRELLDTEMRYCDMLERFIENFYNKLRYRIGAEDMSAIFINIKDIYHLHKRFLAKLVPAVLDALDLSDDATDRPTVNDCDAFQAGEKDSAGLHISDVFVMFKLDFIPYAHYCSRLKSSTRYIDDLERSQPEIRKYIAELNSQTQSQFNLRDLLAVPFQRLLKYPLLLKEMMDASTDVVEQQRIDNALEAMRDVSNYCNEMKRDYEKSEVISVIERSIVCGDMKLPKPFVEWCGRLLQDGIVRMVDHDDGNSNRPKQRYAFLFEKNLIVCKQKSNGFYEFRKAYVISEYELPDSDADQSAANTTSRTNAISRKLTATLFDSTSLSLVRRGYASLLVAGHNAVDAAAIVAAANETSPFIKRASLSSLNINGTLATNPANASVQMLFKSAVQRDNWRKMLKIAIDLNNPPIAAERGHSLLYKTYTRVTECSICKKLLAGKFYQGYHCSGCGCNLHLDCCKHLQYCVARRRLPPLFSSPYRGTTGVATTLGRNTGSPADFQHTRTRSHSAIHFCTPHSSKFQAGDLVVAVRTVVSSIGDTSRLSFNAGDLIEIVDVQPDTGAISRKNAERDRHSAGALNSELLSPHGVSASSRLFATMPTPVSTNTKIQPLTSPPLVSKGIIHVTEERGVNDLKDQPWYFGQCTRADADRLLQGTEDGTFLVRYSEESGRYAISLRYDSIQKHIRIEVCPDSGKYYLCDWRFFNSISDLVAYYRKTNLDECFPKVHTLLGGTPLKGILFRALNSYDRNDDHYLTLRPGDVVTVLGTCNENQGWWLGQINDRVGYFPLSYVKPLEKMVRSREVSRIDDDTLSGDSDRTLASDGVGYAYAANGVRQEITAQPQVSTFGDQLGSVGAGRPAAQSSPLPYPLTTSSQFLMPINHPQAQQHPMPHAGLATRAFASTPRRNSLNPQSLSSATPPMPSMPVPPLPPPPPSMTSLKTEFPSSSTGEPVTIGTTTNTQSTANGGSASKCVLINNFGVPCKF